MKVDYVDVSPASGRVGGDRHDTLPGKRRRYPRTDGLQHAAPGRAAARALEAPIVGTGMEYKAAHDSGVAILSKQNGVVDKVSANEIVIRDETGSQVAV